MKNYLRLNASQLAYIMPASLYTFWLSCVGWLNHYWTFIYLERELVPLLYILFFLAHAAGITIFALWLDLDPPLAKKKKAWLISALLAAFLTVLIAYSPGGWLVLTCLLCGVVSGFIIALLLLFIYQNIAVEKRGLTIGSGSALGVALHFIAYTLLFPQQEGGILYGKTLFAALIMLLLGLCVLYLPFIRDQFWHVKDRMDAAADAVSVKPVLIPILLFILMGFFLSYGIQDLAATSFWMGGEDYLVYTRLFLVIGFIGGGMFCDLRGKHMVLNSSFSLLAMGLISMVFNYKGLYAFIGFSCVQMASAVFEVAILLLFLDLARFYEKQVLVCSLGLVLPSVLKQAGIISADILAKTYSNMHIFVVSLLAIIIVFPLISILFEKMRDVAIISIRQQKVLAELASSLDNDMGMDIPENSGNLTPNPSKRANHELTPAESQASTEESAANWAGLAENFARKYSFTPRETQVLELTLHGLSVLEMAQSLNLSEPTVKQYIRQMLRKTETKNRRELLSMMIKEQSQNPHS